MAEKDKRFYWLKLKTEFMNGEIVDFLMSQKNGANYVVLYEMLAIKTMNTNGRLCSEIGECLIPFDPDKIQRECKWFDIDTIRVAMELYCKLGLIYKDKDNILQIANFNEIVGNETYWAKQKRLQRQDECIGQSLDNVQHTLISNISTLNSNIYNNKEEQKEKEKEEKHKYGEYGWVKLTNEQYSKLKTEFGEDYIDKVIKAVDEYSQSTGNKNKYKDWNLVIRKAIREKWSILRDIEKEKEKDYGIWENLGTVI